MTAETHRSGPAPNGASGPMRRLVGSVGRGLRLVLSSARGELIALAAVQFAIGAGTLAEILIARQVLADVLAAERLGSGFSSAIPEVIAIAVLHGAVLVGFAVQAERHRLIAEKTARRVTAMVLDVAGHVGQDAYDTPDFYDRLERARSSAVIRPMQFTSGLLSVAAGLTIVVGVGVALAVIEPILVALGLVALPAMVISAARNTGELRTFALGLTSDDRRRLYLQSVLSDLAHSKEVRAFDLVGFFRERYEHLYDRRMVALQALVAKRTRRALLAVAAAIMGLAGAVAALGWLLAVGRIDLSSAGAALFALVTLSQRVGSLSLGLSNLYEAAVFLDDICELASAFPIEQLPPARQDLSPELSQLTVDGVRFTYPGASRPVLGGVSLQIARGEVVGLVGSNGSGKTTLVKLLCGLYQPDAGRLKWNGVEVGKPEAAQLRNRVAVLFQDFARYHLSARMNIGTGRHERLNDDDALQLAATQAGAAGLIEGLSIGYETTLSQAFEGGVDLSAGQWQRVALARALFRDAALVILDEPAAALDPLAERRLYEEIRSIAVDRAVLLVTHRAPSLLATDRVYVLHEGMVVESGTHAELADSGGHYAKLFDISVSRT